MFRCENCKEGFLKKSDLKRHALKKVKGGWRGVRIVKKSDLKYHVLKNVKMEESIGMIGFGWEGSHAHCTEGHAYLQYLTLFLLSGVSAPR